MSELFSKTESTPESQVVSSKTKASRRSTSAAARRVEEIPKELQAYMYLHPTGKLLIVKSKRLDPKVLSFQSRLQKLNQVKQIYPVSIEQLAKARQLYDSSLMKSTETIQDALNLFHSASRVQASDIHIRVFRDYADIFYRVHGSMQFKLQLPGPKARSICSAIYGVMCDIADPTYKPHSFQDARIASTKFLPPNLHGIRVASGPKSDGSVMVLRLLYADTKKVDGSSDTRLKDLGYSIEQRQQIQIMMQRPSGINIISGPTGSGKSTTLKHLLESIAITRTDQNILTVEDPPEYPIAGTVQMPVTNADTDAARKQAFGAAIRASLRMDPDIIMVGEVRDQESARLSLQAAMTGHQVWTTLHTNSAFSIFSRFGELISDGSDSSREIASIADPSLLTGLIFQRLAKTLCEDCKIRLKDNLHLVDPIFLKRLQQFVDIDSSEIYLQGPGCKSCASSGIHGRVAIAEVVTPDSEMCSVIREHGIEAAQLFWLQKRNGRTVTDRAFELIEAGCLDPRVAETTVGVFGLLPTHRELLKSSK
jgi:type II secretory ATPase GspE/PulE/Tfp pilus assembly ATPase PilB-like protein